MFGLIPRIYAVRAGQAVHSSSVVLDPTEYPGVVSLDEQSIDGMHRRVPSILQAVTYWYTLRAHGDDLSNRTTQFRIDIRHINLPRQNVPELDENFRFVPRTYPSQQCSGWLRCRTRSAAPSSCHHVRPGDAYS